MSSTTHLPASGSLRGVARRLAEDRRGAVAVIVAVSLPVLLGGLALGVDVAYWRHRQAQLQIAADAAAVSAAIDISNNAAAFTINRNVLPEAQKNCGGNCTAAVSLPAWPRNSALVTVTQTNVPRFFAGAIGARSPTLEATAMARGSVPTTAANGGVRREGSACVLALSSTGAPGVALASPGGAPTFDACEVVSNSANAAAITVSNLTVRSRLTTPGNVSTSGGGSAANRSVGAPAIPNPYAARVDDPAGVFRRSQFPVAFGTAGTFSASDCIEAVVGGVPQPINWALDLSAIPAPNTPNLADRSYSTSLNAVTGVRTHSISGGGGRFCAPLTATNAIINLGPGPWFFDRAVTLNSSSLAAVEGTIVFVSTQIPAAAGASIDGATFVRPAGTAWTIGASSSVRVRAPRVGGFAGFAMTSADNSVAGATTFGGVNADLEFMGIVHLPGAAFGNGASGRVYAIPAVGGLRATGCTQIVAATVSLSNVGSTAVELANACHGMGLSPFGTDPENGWQASTQPTSITRAVLLR